MSIRVQRIGLIVLLIVGIVEVYIFSNGAKVSIETVFGVCSIFWIIHLLKLNIWNREKSFYFKNLSFVEKGLAWFTAALIMIWFVVIFLHL